MKVAEMNRPGNVFIRFHAFSFGCFRTNSLLVQQVPSPVLQLAVGNSKQLPLIYLRLLMNRHELLDYLFVCVYYS